MDVNPTKSEAILFGSYKNLATLSVLKSIVVARSPITVFPCVEVLGVLLDSALSMNQQIASVCKCASFHTRAISHIYPSLNLKILNSLAYSLQVGLLQFSLFLTFLQKSS